jgi:CRP/FNR family transcriptional regulator
MPRTDIASYLRLAPETVSRVLGRLQQSGVIRVERRELEILDGAELEQLAGDVLRA